MQVLDGLKQVKMDLGATNERGSSSPWHENKKTLAEKVLFVSIGISADEKEQLLHQC